MRQLDSLTVAQTPFKRNLLEVFDKKFLKVKKGHCIIKTIRIN